jgi:hypothetical protein
MPSSARDLLDQCLLLDIEVNEKGEIYSLGAVYGEQTFSIPAKKHINQAVLENLDAFAADARCILGHNILIFRPHSRRDQLSHRSQYREDEDRPPHLRQPLAAEPGTGRPLVTI